MHQLKFDIYQERARLLGCIASFEGGSAVCGGHLGQVGRSEEWNKWLVICFQGTPESKDVLFKAFTCPG